MDNENEKQSPNLNNPDGFKAVKPKKKLGPVKGLLLAILIVFLIVVIGLLIRMEIVGDGDYFYPIKKIFGMENEEEVEKTTTKESSKTEAKSTSRLSLLSEDVNEDGVVHYSIEMDLADIYEFYLDLIQNSLYEVSDEEEWYSDDEDDGDDWYYSNGNWYYEEDEDDDDWYYDDEDYEWEDDDEDDWYYDDEDYEWDEDEDDDWYYDEDEDEADYEDYLAGSIIIDLYVKDNQIVQVVFGIDYMELIENLYDEGITPSEDDDEVFESAEDYAEYINSTLKLALTKSTIAEAILQQFEEEDIDVDLTEKDIKNMIDLVRENGLIEIYVTPTEEMNEDLLDYFEENADAFEEADIDADDIFGSLIGYLQNELEEEGYDFLRVTKD